MKLIYFEVEEAIPHNFRPLPAPEVPQNSIFVLLVYILSLTRITAPLEGCGGRSITGTHRSNISEDLYHLFDLKRQLTTLMEMIFQAVSSVSFPVKIWG